MRQRRPNREAIRRAADTFLPPTETAAEPGDGYVSRGDMVTLQSALRRGWPVSQERLATIEAGCERIIAGHRGSGSRLLARATECLAAIQLHRKLQTLKEARQ